MLHIPCIYTYVHVRSLTGRFLRSFGLTFSALVLPLNSKFFLVTSFPPLQSNPPILRLCAQRCCPGVHLPGQRFCNGSMTVTGSFANSTLALIVSYTHTHARAPTHDSLAHLPNAVTTSNSSKPRSPASLCPCFPSLSLPSQLRRG